MHLAGKKNLLADALLRGNIITTEWSLHPLVVKHISDFLGKPHVDLFTSHLNNQLIFFLLTPCSLKGMVSGCTQLQLVRSSCLHPSTNFPATFSPGKERDGTFQSKTHCLILAKTTVFPSPPGPANTTSSQTPHLLGRPDSTHVSFCASRPNHCPSVCSGAVKISLRAAGLSAEVSAMAAKAARNPPDELAITDFCTSPSGARRELPIPIQHL